MIETLLCIALLAGVGWGLYWSWKTGQFSEDIRYLVFTESDKDKMTPEAYAKSREVLAAQIKAREDDRSSRTLRPR